MKRRGWALWGILTADLQFKMINKCYISFYFLSPDLGISKCKAVNATQVLVVVVTAYDGTIDGWMDDNAGLLSLHVCMTFNDMHLKKNNTKGVDKLVAGGGH